MNRILIYITLIVSALFVATLPSCSNEESVTPVPKPPTVDPFKDGELPINLPVTRSINEVGAYEDSIKSARLIVIKNSIVTNNKTFTIADGHLLHRDSVYVLDTIPVGTVSMFIIVNEKTGWGLASIAKGSTYFPEDIERKTLDFSAYPVVDEDNPIPMYRQYKNLHVSNEGVFTPAGGTPISMAALGEVERLYAKVTLVLNAIFTNMANGGDPIKIDDVSIKSMPKQSYLTPSVGLLYPASAGGYFNGAITHPDPDDPDPENFYTEDGVGLHDSLTWYIPEHRLSDTTYLTYISVKASLKDADIASHPDEQVEFKKIILGDGASSIPQDSLRIGSYNNAPISLDKWFITRNTHYTVNATIKSFSKTNDSEIDVTMKVVGWTSVPMDTTDIWQYELTVSQDEFYYPNATDFKGTVTINTNHPEGWSVTTTPPTGKSLYVDNGNGVDTYTTTTLGPQTGTLLRFRCVGWTNAADVGYIDVKAGRHLVKRIKIARN
jgi:hypothetical protein